MKSKTLELVLTCPVDLDLALAFFLPLSNIYTTLCLSVNVFSLETLLPPPPAVKKLNFIPLRRVEHSGIAIIGDKIGSQLNLRNGKIKLKPILTFLLISFDCLITQLITIWSLRFFCLTTSLLLDCELRVGCAPTLSPCAVPGCGFVLNEGIACMEGFLGDCSPGGEGTLWGCEYLWELGELGKVIRKGDV